MLPAPPGRKRHDLAQFVCYRHDFGVFVLDHGPGQSTMDDNSVLKFYTSQGGSADHPSISAQL